MNNRQPQQLFINGRFLSQSVTGVQRYAEEVVKRLDALLDDKLFEAGSRFSLTLLSPRNTVRELDLKQIRQVKAGRFTGHLWEQLSLPALARGGGLISLCNTGPLAKSDQIVTIHDASVFGFPAAYSFAFRSWYRVLFRGLGQRARRIVTDSRFSQQELKRYCKMAPEKTRVIHLGCEHLGAVSADSSVLERHGLVRDGFVLAVSSLNPNKNFRAIVDAINILGGTRYRFVIAGAANVKVFGRADLSLPPQVVQVGYVSDGELKALYENAACFVYPSFYEGFGLPPLEAMSCGCPVIVSEAASLPEVCGDAALYCNPREPDDLAAKIQRLMADPALRQRLRLAGGERIGRFSWDQCARELWAEIEEVFAR